MGLLNWLVSPLASAFGWGSNKDKKDPYAALLAQLKPLTDAQTKITTEAGEAGIKDTTAARNDFGYVSKFFKDMLEGSPDDLMKFFDAQGLTRNIDENEQQLAEQGVRGGRRAAVMGQSYFSRDSALNKMLEQIRFSAPDKIADIATRIGNLGIGEFNASTGASGTASQNIFGVEQLRQADKQRKAELLASIFEAIGGVAGAVAAGGGG